VQEPFADSRMVVKEKLDERRWLDICQVLVGHASHRALEGIHHLCRLQRILVRLVLDGPAQTIADGQHDQSEDAGEQQYIGDSGNIGQCQVVVLAVNSPMQDQVDQVQHAKGEHRLADNQFPEVSMDVMPQFMGKHHLNLVRSVTAKHGITQHDTARVSQAHQGGIGGGRLAAQLHAEDASHVSMGAVSQCQQSLRQLPLRQWAELVEKRQDQHRREIRHHDREEKQDQRDPQPPCLWLRCQQKVDQFQGEHF